MENWFQHIFLKDKKIHALMISTSAPLRAFVQCVCLVVSVLLVPMTWADDEKMREEAVSADIERVPVNVGAIDAADFEVGVFYGVLSIEDFGADSVIGLRGAYHVSENLMLEATYAASSAGETSFELLSGSAQLLTDDQRDYSYYNMSVAYSILPGETFIAKRWAFNSALYVVAGIGSTEFAGDDHFTVNFGAGYRILFNDWSALHIDVRDHLFDSDLLGTSKTVHNIELSVGFSVFF